MCPLHPTTSDLCGTCSGSISGIIGSILLVKRLMTPYVNCKLTWLWWPTNARYMTRTQLFLFPSSLAFLYILLPFSPFSCVTYTFSSSREMGIHPILNNISMEHKWMFSPSVLWFKSSTLVGHLVSASCRLHGWHMSTSLLFAPPASVNWVYNRNTNSTLTKVILSSDMIRLRADVLW
jgi:hypothetical protein